LAPSGDSSPICHTSLEPLPPTKIASEVSTARTVGDQYGGAADGRIRNPPAPRSSPLDVLV